MPVDALKDKKALARGLHPYQGQPNRNKRSKYHDLGGIKLLFVGRLKVLNYKNVQNRY